MVSKRCLICGKIKGMDDQDACCSDCEDIELDILIAVYAYIHITGQDYCPPDEIIENVDPVREIKINLTFLRSWVQKEWLEKDNFNAVGVPAPVQESIEEGGFNISDCLRQVLQRQKEHKPPYDPEILNGFKKDSAEKRRHHGMVFMEKKDGSRGK
jgi:hypothetical protein